MARVNLIDVSLRDGMHAVDQRFTPKQMAEVAKKLDEAGVYAVEVGHGDGLGASTIQYGWSAANEEDYFSEVSKVLKSSRLCCLMMPGIGTKMDLERCAKYGVKVARVATLCTEVDIGEQHIKLAKEMGLETVGFMMMSHIISAEELLEKGRLFESYGADLVYVTDSAGAMTPREASEKTRLLVENLSVPIGFHAHNNLAAAVANSFAAAEAGATFIDGSIVGLGAGAGNAQLEAVAACLDKAGYETGVKLYPLLDLAEGIVRPMLDRHLEVGEKELMLGYAGVYSSFLLHIMRAAERFKVDSRDIIVELGKRKVVGGQEDQIVDVAYGLSRRTSS